MATAEFKKRKDELIAANLSALAKSLLKIDEGEKRLKVALERSNRTIAKKKALPAYPKRVSEMVEGIVEKFKIAFLDDYGDELLRLVDSLKDDKKFEKRTCYETIYLLMLISCDPTTKRPPLASLFTAKNSFESEIQAHSESGEPFEGFKTHEYNEVFKEWLEECLEESDISEDSGEEIEGDLIEDTTTPAATHAECNAEDQMRDSSPFKRRYLATAAVSEEFEFVDVIGELDSSGYLNDLFPSVVVGSSCRQEVSLTLAAVMASMGRPSNVFKLSFEGDEKRIPRFYLRRDNDELISENREILGRFIAMGEAFRGIIGFCREYREYESNIVRSLVESIQEEIHSATSVPLEYISRLINEVNKSTDDDFDLVSYTPIGAMTALSKYFSVILCLSSLSKELAGVLSSPAAKSTNSEIVGRILTYIHNLMLSQLLASGKDRDLILQIIFRVYASTLTPYVMILNSLLHSQFSGSDIYSEFFVLRVDSAKSSSSQISKLRSHVLKPESVPILFAPIAEDVLSALRTIGYLEKSGRGNSVSSVADTVEPFLSCVREVKAAFAEARGAGEVAIQDVSFGQYIGMIKSLSGSLRREFLSPVLLEDLRLVECFEYAWGVFLLLSHPQDADNNFITSMVELLDVKGQAVDFSHICNVLVDNYPSRKDIGAVKLELTGNIEMNGDEEVTESPQAGMRKSVASFIDFMKFLKLGVNFQSEIVSDLFPVHAIKLYRSIHFLMVDIERATYLLNLAHVKVSKLHGDRSCSVWERRCLIQLSHFLNVALVFKDYIRNVVVAPSAKKFLSGLTELGSFEEIYNEHMNHVQSLVNNCFLSAQFQPLLRRFTSLLHMADDYAVLCLTNADGIPSSAATVETSTDFSKSIKYLVSMLHSFSENSGNSQCKLFRTQLHIH